jgi:hypothetical protein
LLSLPGISICWFDFLLFHSYFLLDYFHRISAKRKDTKGLWFDVGDVKAREKTSHALREGISEDAKTSGGGKIFDGKLHHHQAKKIKNNNVNRGEESSADADMEHREDDGQQRITSLTTNKNVATSNRRGPSGSSVPGASVSGSSSDLTGRPEQAQASNRGETRSKASIGRKSNKLEAYFASLLSLFLKNAAFASRVLLRFAIYRQHREVLLQKHLKCTIWRPRQLIVKRRENENEEDRRDPRRRSGIADF